MTEISKIEYVDTEKGMVYLRNSALVVFFINRKIHEVSEQILTLMDMYLNAIPGDALKWAVVGATSESWQEIDGKTISKCKALLSPEGAKKRKLTAFRLGDNPDGVEQYGVHIIGKTQNPAFPDAQTMLQMWFPIDAMYSQNVESLYALVKKMGCAIDFSSGYCAPALSCSILHNYRIYQEMRGLCARHPGYDVHNNRILLLESGGLSRGARWISLIGPELVKKLGGLKKIEAKLHAQITVEQVGKGCLIRAGTLPEIGDTNRRIDTPLLRQVARLLEPVTYFGESGLIFSKYEEDDIFLNRWERRLLG